MPVPPIPEIISFAKSATRIDDAFMEMNNSRAGRQKRVFFLVFVVVAVWNFMRLDAGSHSASDTIRPFVIQSLALVVFLLFICYCAGEKPGWHWVRTKKR